MASTRVLDASLMWVVREKMDFGSMPGMLMPQFNACKQRIFVDCSDRQIYDYSLQAIDRALLFADGKKRFDPPLSLFSGRR
jgi:hypothetical protein